MWYPEGLWNEPCYVIHILHFSCLVFVQSFQPHHCCRIANIPGLPLLVYLSSVARFQDHETFRTEGIYRLFMLKAYKYFFFHSRRKTKNLIYLLLLLKSVIDRVMVSHRGMQMNCGKTDLQIRSPGDFLQNLQEHRIMDYALHESTILLLEFGPSWNNLILRVEVTVLHPISTAGVQHVLMWNGNSIPEPFQLALLQTLALVWHQLSPCSLSGTFCAKRESQLVKSALCSLWSHKNGSFGWATTVLSILRALFSSMLYRDSVMPVSHKPGGACKVCCRFASFPFVLHASLLGWSSAQAGSRSEVLHLVGVLMWGV